MNTGVLKISDRTLIIFVSWFRIEFAILYFDLKPYSKPQDQSEDQLIPWYAFFHFSEKSIRKSVPENLFTSLG